MAEKEPFIPPKATSGWNDQYIIQPPSQSTLNELAEVKMQYGMTTTVVGEVVDSKDALIKNNVSLAEKQKQRMPHKGFIENAVGKDITTVGVQGFPGYIDNPPYDTAYPDEQYVKATDDDYKYLEDTDWRWVSGEAVKVKPRDIIKDKYAKTDDGYAIPEDDNYGTFTVEYFDADGNKVTEADMPDGEIKVPPYRQNIKFTPVEYNPSVSGEEDDLINPTEKGLAADNVQVREIKTHYRRGEVEFDGITEEHYLDRPGVEVKTSQTFIAKEEERAKEEEEDTESESTPDESESSVEQAEATKAKARKATK